jgi:hypothetical protein
MRIVISGRASLYSDGLPSEPDAVLVTDPAVLRTLDGYDGEEDDLADDIDATLRRAGVRGGTLTFSYVPERNEVRVISEYRCPRPLTESELELLVRETVGAWSDGVGENGWEAEWEGGEGMLYPNPAGYPGGDVPRDLRVEQLPGA